MVKKKKHLLKWRPNWGSSLTVQIFLLIFCIVMLALMQQNAKLFFILFLVGIAFNIVVFVYNNFLGFNAPIYFDDEKVFSNVNGKKYVWSWDEVTAMEIYTLPARSLTVMIKIITSPKYKELKFHIDPYRYQTFMQICPNEMVKKKLKEFMEEDE